MSLHGHSSANAAQQYIIFSLDDQSPAAMAHFRHWCAANGIDRKTVLGRYNGKAEYSELVKLGDWFTNICVTSLVANQESILFLDLMNARDRRPAQLIYLDGRVNYIELLGELGEVSREEALASDAYTFDPSGGVDRWFICKKVWPAGTMHKGERQHNAIGTGYCKDCGRWGSDCTGTPIDIDHKSEREFAKLAKAYKPVHGGYPGGAHGKYARDYDNYMGDL